jgi:hypothetical protein
MQVLTPQKWTNGLGKEGFVQEDYVGVPFFEELVKNILC